jgi:DNA repair protein RadC
MLGNVIQDCMITTRKSSTYRLRDRDLLFRADDTQYVLRVKDLPDDEKPREKLVGLGAVNMSNAELLAIVWGVGTKSEDVLAMAKRTLKDYGERAIGNEFNPVHLAEAVDIPLQKACQVVAGFELGRRYYAIGHTGRPVQVRTAKQARQYLKDMGSATKEQLRGLYLNTRYQVVHDEVISIGSLTSNVVHPREVFQPAIEHGAVAIIIAHNHPSGRLEPTEADLYITKQLLAAADILGIELLDHLIITAERHASVLDFLERQ